MFGAAHRGFRSSAASLAASLAVSVGLGLGCDKEPPPSPADAVAAATSGKPDTASGTGPVDASATTSADAPTSADASAGDVAADAPADIAPPLYADDGGPLGQTDALPTLDSPSYAQRTRLLWEAIVRDEPAHAAAAFFPLVAYAQVKAIPNPPADYKQRLLGAFARDIHAYHKKLGDEPTKARFIALEIPVAKAKWMEPGSEGNKLGYDRVLDGKLVFTRSDGTEGSLPVKSMISWRGEWYVVHLNSFK